MDLGDFKGIGEISRDFKVSQGISSNFMDLQGISLGGTLRYKYIRFIGDFPGI